MIPIAIATAQITVGLLAVAALAAAGWFALARLPNRAARKLAGARRTLERGDWAAALNEARRLTPPPNSPPAGWHESRDLLEGECLMAAGDASLQNNDFDDAIARFREAARLLDLPEDQATRRAVEAMLAEARRLSVIDRPSAELAALLARIRTHQPICPEADFMAGLQSLRSGDEPSAVSQLTAAHSGSRGQPGDAALYLGGILLRSGMARDALRHLAEMNKSAPQCPIVAWQLGTALAAGGDPLLAVRALQKAIGPDGLPRFLVDANSMWIQTLPAESWIRNLVRHAAGRKAVYRCPLGFDDVKTALQSARRTLAEAQVKAGKPDEALRILNDLVHTDDTSAVRHSLGTALSMVGRYDEALPHLRRALELEDPPGPQTAGALALCLTKAGGDRKANAVAALKLIAEHRVPGDAAWAGQAAAVFAAARAAGFTIPPEQIADLAGDLATSDAHDRAAAEIYDLLAQHDLNSVPYEAAILYVRAAQEHGVRLARDIELFQHAFREREHLRQAFEFHEWDFAAAERLFLERWAERYPGTFPKSAGGNYAVESEATLLDDSRQLETQGQLSAAQSAAELALKLAPSSGAAHDRLAELAFRRGQIPEAIDWLNQWQTLAPHDAAPPTRLALLYLASHRLAEAAAAISHARTLVRERERAPSALLAARIALANEEMEKALGFLNECLTINPAMADALAARAAILWTRGSTAELANLSEPLGKLNSADPWIQYLAAVSGFAAGRDELAVKRAQIVARADGATSAAGHHLLGLLHDRARRPGDAVAALHSATQRSQGPTVEHARAILGQIAWNSREIADALKSWQAIPPNLLKSWRLDAVIPGGALLAGLRSLRAQRWDDAAKWLRAAARMRCQDPRLGEWLALACDQGGTDSGGQDTSRLQSAIEAAGPLPALIQRLARRQRRAGRLIEARKSLDSIETPHAGILVERGLLALAENQPLVAERAFSDAVALEPNQPAATLNAVFARLSLGRIDAAAALLPNAIDLAPTVKLKRLSQCLQRLITGDSALVSDWSAADDEIALDFIRRAGRWDTVDALFDSLLKFRGDSAAVRKAHAEIAALRAKDMINRGESANLLRRFGPVAQSATPIIRNLLGVAAALRQDFDSAIRHFTAAMPQTGDARIEQNLALIREWQGRMAEAAHHWRRCVEGRPGQSIRIKEIPNYRRRLDSLARERLARAASELQSTE